MTDPIERRVREALSDRAAHMDTDAIARLRAVDYRPRRRRIAKLPALGGLGAAGIAGAVVATVSLTSASTAFAGWSPTPHRTTPRQLSLATQDCGSNLGSPVLTDSRGPYTAAIYTSGDTTAVCLSGNNVNLSSVSSSTSPTTPAAGQVDFGGGGQRDSEGNDLTLADGQIGAGVTGVTIELSDGTSVVATVSDGYYMAWWPGTATAARAEITTAAGTQTEAMPTAPSVPACPSNGQCSAGWSSAPSGPAGGSSFGRASISGSASSSGSVGNSGAVVQLSRHRTTPGL